MSTETKPDVGQRNSEYRQISEAFLDRPVKIFHARFPSVSADHVSTAGVVLSIAGIHLMESQHRIQKYNPKKTLLAVGLVGIGMALDLFDGKLARLRRSEMPSDEDKLKDEKIGQVKDPFFDGIVETVQALESAYTAHVLGSDIRKKAAFFSLMTSNIPRTLKAVAGMFEKSVPESYKPYDIRFFGTSLGRKVPNYLSTLISRSGGFTNIIAGLANTGVGIERMLAVIDGIGTIFDPSVKPELSSKEIGFAGARAKYLGIQTVGNIVVALVASKVLKS